MLEKVAEQSQKAASQDAGSRMDAPQASASRDGFILPDSLATPDGAEQRGSKNLRTGPGSVATAAVPTAAGGQGGGQVEREAGNLQGK